jgi:hypothetical protein
MSQNNVIPAQKINDAAAGNEALREVIQALTQTSNLQTNVTNTSGKNVPPQAKSTVSYLKGNYEVAIQNPGSSSPTSAFQAAQAANAATLSSNIAPLTAFYHQIRVATSPRFDIASNVQVFGGDTGSAQTYWTLTGLGSGRFYFQVRSSYDGVNFNLWRNANGGQTITGGLEGVTVEQVENGLFALFTLPGSQLVAFGEALCHSGSGFGVPTELYTSAMQALAGPNGYDAQLSNLAHGITAETVGVQTPNPPVPQSGPADYPTILAMTYADGSGNTWSGSSSIFAFCYDPLGTNASEQATADGVWVDFVLPGGAHFTVGNGVTNDGTNIAFPSAMPWVDGSRMVRIVSPAVGFDPTRQARGIVNASLDAQAPVGGVTAMKMNCGFADTTANRWSSTGNWFAMSWSPGLPIITTADGTWLPITLPDGTKVAVGSGRVGNGLPFTLPAGFTADKMVAIATPASVDATSHPMAGIYRCTVSGVGGSAGTDCSLLFTDTQGNGWGGDCNFIAFIWQ